MKQYTLPMPEDGDRSQGWALLAVTWAFVTVALVTTVLRVYVRTKLTHNIGPDDWTMVVCLLTTVFGAGLVTSEVTAGGLGRHSYYLEPAQKRNFAAIGWSDWIQTFITLALMKISICLFLLRIVDARKLRLALWGLIGFLVLFTTIFVFLFIGVCRPLRAYWRIEKPGDHCFSELQVQNITLAQGVFSAITDIICAVFPILFLRGLHVSLKTKVALCVLMGLGLITAVCAIVRTALSGALTKPDLTWAIIPNVAWRLPEVNIGIACANAPVCRPLYLFFRGRLDTQRSKKLSASGGSSTKNRFGIPGNSRWKEGNSTTLQGSGENEKRDQNGGITIDESVDLELGPQVPPKDGFGTRAEAWS